MWLTNTSLCPRLVGVVHVLRVAFSHSRNEPRTRVKSSTVSPKNHRTAGWSDPQGLGSGAALFYRSEAPGGEATA